MSPSEIDSDIENLISKSHGSKKVWSLLGSKLVDINPSKALELLDNDNFKDIMNRIICFKNLNDNEMALKLAKQAITIDPNNVNSLIAAGWSAYDLGRYKEANNFFDSALGCDIYCPDALFGKGLVMKITGKDYSYYQKALTEIDLELVI